MSYERALAAIKADLDRIPAASRWCYHNGYWPLRPDHDRPTPLRDPDAHPDHVPGAMFDHGLGAYQCRTAWVTARGHMAAADQQTAGMLAHFGSGALCAPLRIRDEDRHEFDVPKYAQAITRRVTLIQVVAGRSGPDMREWVCDSLTANYGPVWRAAEAYAELTTHHHRAGDQVARQPTVAMCSICRIQAAAPKKGGLCERCAKRIQRDERPRSVVITELRQEATVELERAKFVRSQHGCGYGAA